MTPQQKAAMQRLDKILEDAKKNIKLHEEWAEDIKRNRKERKERLHRKMR